MISKPSLRALRDKYALLHCEMQVRAHRYAVAIEHNYEPTVSWLNQVTQLCEANRLAYGVFGLAPKYSITRDGIESRGEANLETWTSEFKGMVADPGRSIGVWLYPEPEEVLDFLRDARLGLSGIRILGATKHELVFSLASDSLPDWVTEYSGVKTLGSHW